MFAMTRRGSLTAAALALSLAWALAGAQPAPEAVTGYSPKPALVATKRLIVAANPVAADAGLEMLRLGGSAADAAIAAQLVLALVEPQSSGLGGGGFLVHWSARERRVRTYDGRETAPAAATPSLFLDESGKPLAFSDAIASGRSVGVPGLVRLIELVHQRHGRLPLTTLFGPAIRLAENGFDVSPRLAALVAQDRLLPGNAAARSYLFDASGMPLAAGTRVRNPELAQVLRAVASGGADAFYRGEMARDIVAAAAAVPRGGALAESDLASYRAKERTAVCGIYRVWRLCGMPPPSSGGTTVLAILGILERFPMQQFGPETLMGAHLFAEAGKLAYADRDRYVADPDFVSVPVAAMIDPGYLRRRSGEIRFSTAVHRAEPGQLGRAPVLSSMRLQDSRGTTHISVVDSEGNAVAMTTSVESAFGTRRFVRGFFLNNQLTDFSLVPERDGNPVANRVEPGKRPRSSMAPTLVFDRAGRVVIVIGSPGGTWIPNYVARSLVAMLDWHAAADAAVALPHVGSRNGPTDVERGTAAENLRPGLEALGHEVRIIDMPSGLHVIARDAAGWIGAADPRREGAARGD